MKFFYQSTFTTRKPESGGEEILIFNISLIHLYLYVLILHRVRTTGRPGPDQRTTRTATRPRTPHGQNTTEWTVQRVSRSHKPSVVQKDVLNRIFRRFRLATSRVAEILS